MQGKSEIIFRVGRRFQPDQSRRDDIFVAPDVSLGLVVLRMLKPEGGDMSTAKCGAKRNPWWAWDELMIHFRIVFQICMQENLVTASIDLTLRPLKFGFIVDPKKNKQVKEAIETATFLWGGAACPIIPNYKRVPDNYSSHPVLKPTSKKFFNGIINAFDPDYLVNFDSVGVNTIANRRVIRNSGILQHVKSYGAPEYGAGLFEILDHWRDTEFKFIRSEPIRVCIPKIPKNFGLFFSAVFGTLPPHIESTLLSRYGEDLRIEKLDCNLSNYVDLLAPSDLYFPRRISSLFTPLLDVNDKTRAIFLLDASNAGDVIDYWNLRAAGWFITPIPIQSTRHPNVVDFCKELIKSSFVGSFFNMVRRKEVNIMKARSVQFEVFKEFYEKFDDRETAKVVHTHLPRIWDDWARPYDHVEVKPLSCGEVTRRVHSSLQSFVFSPLQPEFKLFGWARQQFANDISMRIEGSDELLAEVMPEGGLKMVRAIDRYDLFKWRFSKRGLTLLGQRGESARMMIPHAKTIFTEWLEEQGWQIALSDAGKTTEAMLSQLGGIYGLNLLANYDLIAMLINSVKPTRVLAGPRSELRIALRKNRNVASKIKELDSRLTQMERQFGYEVSVIPRAGLIEQLNKIAPGYSIIHEPDDVLKQLIHRRILELGVTPKCTTCSKSTWLPRTEIGSEVPCPVCGGLLNLMDERPGSLPWSYRLLGPFRSPGAAHGSYTVLLTLRFFSHFLHSGASTTPLLSFVAKKENALKEIEADLGLFMRYNYLREETRLIFGECKTTNNFTNEDVDKIAFIMSEFPEAACFFATLKTSLDDSEKRLIGTMIRKIMKARKTSQVIPVMILTRKELATEHLLTSFDSSIGLKADTLESLCEATQKTYADFSIKEKTATKVSA